MSEVNENNCRRARDLIIPYNWNTVGIYEPLLDTGELWLRFRYGGGKAVRINHPDFMGITDLTNVVVTKNFSKQRATLCRGGKLVALPCSQMFPIVDVLRRSMSAQDAFLALENGQLALPPVQAEVAPAPGHPSAPTAALASKSVLANGATDDDEHITTPAPKRRKSLSEVRGDGHAQAAQSSPPSASPASANGQADPADAIAEMHFSPRLPRSSSSASGLEAGQSAKE